MVDTWGGSSERSAFLLRSSRPAQEREVVLVAVFWQRERRKVGGEGEREGFRWFFWEIAWREGC